MNKEIEQLIKRFMDGQTTVDEENRIAEYLRTHEVEDEWKPYKDMFGWFDDGMPLQSNGQKHTAKNRSKAITVAMLMAAAAAIVALVMMVRPGTPDIMPEQTNSKRSRQTGDRRKYHIIQRYSGHRLYEERGRKTK